MTLNDTANLRENSSTGKSIPITVSSTYDSRGQGNDVMEPDPSLTSSTRPNNLTSRRATRQKKDQTSDRGLSCECNIAVSFFALLKGTTYEPKFRLKMNAVSARADVKGGFIFGENLSLISFTDTLRSILGVWGTVMPFRSSRVQSDRTQVSFYRRQAYTNQIHLFWLPSTLWCFMGAHQD